MMSISKMFAAAIAVAAIAASSFAGTVDVKFVGTGLGRNVQVNRNGNATNLFAGQLMHNFSNGQGDCVSLSGTQATFCTELTEYVATNTSPFDSAALEDAPESGPMGAAAAQAVKDIYAQANGRQFATSGTVDNKDLAAAFQIAIWEVVTDYDGTAASLDVTAGDLKVTKMDGSDLSAGVADYLAELFGAVGMNADGDGIFAVVNDCYQDQIVMVPLPAAALLGAAGLGVIIWRRRKLASK